MKARYTPAQRQKHLQAWQSSGLSQSAYCREHKLKLQTFSHWQLSQSKIEAAAEPAAPFIPIQISKQSGKCEPPITVNTTDGLSISCQLTQLTHIIQLLKSC